MNHRNLICTALSLTLLVIVGCSKSGGPSFASLPSFGSSSSSSDTSSSSSSGSNNELLNMITQRLPGQTGDYVLAGSQAFSGLKLGAGDEDAMGRGVAIGVTSRYPIIDNAPVNQYVALVGFTVADASPRPDGHFVFGVLDTPEVGAFSGPNGYVMITRGALLKMEDESELAGVISHEIAHVCHHDGLHAVQNVKLTGAAAKAAKTAMQANQTATLFNSAVDTSTDVVLVKGYDQNQELAADNDAVKFMTAAGYDPDGYLRFVDRIAAQQPTGNGGLFSTHPGFAKRAQTVAAAIQASGKGGVGATNAARFRAAIAGLG